MNASSTPEGQALKANAASAQREACEGGKVALLDRLIQHLLSLKEAASRPKLRAGIGIAATTLLMAGLAIAMSSLPQGIKLESPAYGWRIFFIIAPAIIIMNTLETEFTARILGVRFGWREALRIAVLSSAANTLPLPGGPMVRAIALKERGVKLTRSSGLIAAATGLWIALVFLYAGFCLAALSGSAAATGLFLGIGAIGAAAAFAWLRRLSCSIMQIFALGLLKMVMSAIGVFGLWWTFALLGASPGFFETSMLSVSAASGLVVTFVPAGIGVTEAASAGIAMLVSISPALAFLVSAIFRAIWLAFLFPVASLFIFTSALPKRGVVNADAESINRQTHAVTGAQSRRNKAEKINTILSRRTSVIDATILDVGAGSGEIAHYFAQTAAAKGEVIGIDTVDQRSVGLNFQFKLSNGTGIQSESDTFDIVISNHVIEHVGGYDQQAHHLSEIKRVLNKDGLLYLAVPNKRGFIEPHYRLPFLSWLPQNLADRFVKICRRGDAFDCRLLSRADIRLLTAGQFEIEDATREALRIYIEQEMSGISADIASIAERVFYPALEPFIPTLIFICRPLSKPRT